MSDDLETPLEKAWREAPAAHQLALIQRPEIFAHVVAMVFTDQDTAAKIVEKIDGALATKVRNRDVSRKVLMARACLDWRIAGKGRDLFADMVPTAIRKKFISEEYGLNNFDISEIQRGPKAEFAKPGRDLFDGMTQSARRARERYIRDKCADISER